MCSSWPPRLDRQPLTWCTAMAASACRSIFPPPAPTGACRRNSSEPDTPSCRHCPPSRMGTGCWCSTATCRCCAPRPYDRCSRTLARASWRCSPQGSPIRRGTAGWYAARGACCVRSSRSVRPVRANAGWMRSIPACCSRQRNCCASACPGCSRAHRMANSISLIWSQWRCGVAGAWSPWKRRTRMRCWASTTSSSSRRQNPSTAAGVRRR